MWIRFCINIPADICMLKVNNTNTKTRCELCLRLTIKTPHFTRYSSVCIVDFEPVTAGWNIERRESEYKLAKIILNDAPVGVRSPFAINFGSQWSKEQIFGYGMFRVIIKGQTPLHTRELVVVGELVVGGSLTISPLKFSTLMIIVLHKILGN